MKYSIIYAVIRPEISERVSLGLIFVDGDKVDVRYSQQKLEAVRGLFPPKEYEFLSRVVTSMPTEGSINSVEAINYLLVTTFTKLRKFAALSHTITLP